MSSDDITKAQAKELHAKFAPTLRLLSALRQRMKARRFPTNDQLSLAADRAYDGMHWLVNALHYMTCDGVGPPRAEE